MFFAREEGGQVGKNNFIWRPIDGGGEGTEPLLRSLCKGLTTRKRSLRKAFKNFQRKRCRYRHRGGGEGKIISFCGPPRTRGKESPTTWKEIVVDMRAAKGKSRTISYPLVLDNAH